jgi:hypothetical protein
MAHAFDQQVQVQVIIRRDILACTHVRVCRHVRCMQVECPASFSPALVDLIRRLLATDAAARVPAFKAIQHRVFNGTAGDDSRGTRKKVHVLSVVFPLIRASCGTSLLRLNPVTAQTKAPSSQAAPPDAHSPAPFVPPPAPTHTPTHAPAHATTHNPTHTTAHTPSHAPTQTPSHAPPVSAASPSQQTAPQHGEGRADVPMSVPMVVDASPGYRSTPGRSSVIDSSFSPVFSELSKRKLRTDCQLRALVSVREPFPTCQSLLRCYPVIFSCRIACSSSRLCSPHVIECV